MLIYKIDGSLDGLLTAVFDSFYRKECPDMLLRHDGILPLFYDGLHDVIADDAKAERVWRGLERKLSHGALSALSVSYLCGEAEFDMQLFRLICRAVTAKQSIEGDFSDTDLLSMLGYCRKVRGEAHRLLQFVRFQKAADGTYFAMTEPMYDVLPMVVEHFRDRLSDSRFVVYDRCRDYGFYYDGKSVERMCLRSGLSHLTTGRLPEYLMDANEKLFQQLWRTYFNATAIKERMNPRKQRQDMPVRYWKYLTEKFVN